MKAIILAAGYATRLYPLTLHTPKALLPIHQKPIINYIVEQMETIQALDAIYVVSNHKFYDQFEAWAKALCCKKPITVLDDGTTSEENRRGAIGDILYTIETMQLDDELMVVAGDNLFTFSLQAYVDFFHQMGKDCVCVKPIEDYEALKSFGVAQLDETGKLIGLEEKPKEPKSNLASMGIYIFNYKTLRKYLTADEKDPNSEHDFGKDIIPAMLNNGEKLVSYRFKGYWKDVCFSAFRNSVCKKMLSAVKSASCNISVWKSAPSSLPA